MATTIHPTIANAILADRAAQRRKRNDAWIRLGLELGAAFIRGLWLMLAIGIVHHEWIPACPTIGYSWSVVLAGLLTAALFPISNRNKS